MAKGSQRVSLTLEQSFKELSRVAFQNDFLLVLNDGSISPGRRC